MRGRNYCWLSLLTVALLTGEPAARGYTHGQAVGFDLYYNYLIVAQGSAGRLKGLNFLLDTGASPSVLDRRLAQELHLEDRPVDIATLNGSVAGEQAIVPSMGLGPIKRENLNVLVEDLSFIQKSLPVHIDGIVGLDLLGQSAFEIDYTSREIRFGPVPSLATSLPFRVRAGLPIVDAELNYFSVPMLLDTGANSLVLFKARTAGPVSPTKIASVQQSPDTIGELERKLVRPQSVRLGEAEFGKKPVLLAPSRADWVQDDFDGLMSPAALGITKLAIDPERGTLSFSR